MSIGLRGGCGRIPTAETESQSRERAPPLSSILLSLFPRFSSFSSLSSLAAPSSSLPLKRKELRTGREGN